MKTRTRWCVGIGAAALACVFALACAAAADDAADGRAICAKCSSAVVKVQVVVKMTSSYGGESNSHERKSEVVGTVIDPSGLTVASLACTDPSSSGGEEDEEFKTTSEVTDVKIILADGKEISAKLVLRDKDLDLAFIRPVQKPTAPMAAVDLKDSAKVDIMDKVLIVTRLGKVANRTLSACLERIQAVVDKPRKFYAVSMSSMGEEYGSPVFAMDGKAVGIVLYRQMLGRSDSEDSDWIPVVIPAEDILPAAAQAPEDAPKVAEKPTQPAKNKDGK